ncbi:DMT family transporter [Paenibacillus ehimensis]|uniref:DMT family transporter n=1 Tax=Paenibacillus ehimensis TaxID=79264 RepID=UPI0013E3AFDE|nr:DMT family transporter [Paenibacillus ehimensis]MEC0209528.1 DMT family transporter [Paenibacillus ehimensis]
MLKKSYRGRNLGLALIIVGAGCWGLSSPMMEWLFSHQKMSAPALLQFRFMLSGVILLLIAMGRKQNIWKVWTDLRMVLSLLIFSVCGIMVLQYAFISTVETGNAVTATLFQFLSPAVVMIVLAFKKRKPPTWIETVLVSLCIIGLFFMVTNGSLEGISLSPKAVGWGLATAVAFAFYTLFPVPLIRRWGGTLVLGWGMLIGGIVFNALPVSGGFYSAVQGMDVISWILVLFIVLFGTCLAFLFYLESLHYLEPAETNTLSVMEPLVTIVVSMLWLAEPLKFFQIMGGLFIVASSVLLSVKPWDKRARGGERTASEGL